MVKTVLFVAGVFLVASVGALASGTEEASDTGTKQMAVPAGKYREAPVLTELVASGRTAAGG